MKNKNSIIVLFFQLFQTLVSVFSLILISRGFSVEVFGNYIFIVTICSLLALFSGFGSEHVFLMKASRDISQIDVLFGRSLLIRAFVNVIFITIGFFFNYLTEYKFWIHSVFMLGYSIASFVNPLFVAFYRVRGDHIKPWIFSLIGPIIFLLYLIWFCAYDTLIQIGYFFLLSNLIMFIIFFIDLKQNFKFSFRSFNVRENGKIGFIFMLSQIFDYIFLRVDVLVVKFLLGPYLLGIYAVGQRLVSFLQIIPSSFHIVELPVFHSLSSNLSELQLHFLRLRSSLIQIGVVLFGLLVLNSKWLIVLFFSSKYKESELVVWILSLAGLINFACYPYYMLAEALNKINERLFIRIITLICTISLLFLFCFFYKNEGASIAILFGSFLFISLLHYLTIVANGALKMAITDIKTIIISIIALLLFIFINRIFNYSLRIVILTNFLFACSMILVLFKFGNLKAKIEDYIRKDGK